MEVASKISESGSVSESVSDTERRDCVHHGWSGMGRERSGWPVQSGDGRVGMVGPTVGVVMVGMGRMCGMELG